MLTITIPATEQWDEKANEFVTTKETTLQLEHSLISISKWEATWQKPFLSSRDKTIEQTIDYIKCMTINTNVDPSVYRCLTNANIKEIEDYIYSPMTATTVYEDPMNKSPVKKNKIITSEEIYSWMINLNIPFQCEKWHLNRLLMLIRVCGIHNKPPKKMSRNDILSRNAALNEMRKKQYHTKG